MFSFCLKHGDIFNSERRHVVRGNAVILGPSGSGKSTFLKCLAGLLPYQGQILFATGGDQDPWIQPTRNSVGIDRQVSVAWQDPHLIPSLTVLDNLKVVDCDPTIRNELVRTFGVQALLDRYPHEISGGEAQRINLIRALSAPSRLVLLDEPMQGLDPILVRKLFKKILSFCSRHNKQVLAVTHEVYHVYGLFDYALMFHAGRVHAKGNFEKLYNEPPSPWAANFFGPYFVLSEDDLKCFNHHLDERTCFVRPEWLKIKDAVPGQRDANAEVTSVRWDGPSIKVNVRLLRTGKPLTVEVNTDAVVHSGQKVYVNFKKCSRPSWV